MEKSITSLCTVGMRSGGCSGSWIPRKIEETRCFGILLLQVLRACLRACCLAVESNHVCVNQCILDEKILGLGSKKTGARRSTERQSFGGGLVEAWELQCVVRRRKWHGEAMEERRVCV